LGALLVMCGLALYQWGGKVTLKQPKVG